MQGVKIKPKSNLKDKVSSFFENAPKNWIKLFNTQRLTELYRSEIFDEKMQAFCKVVELYFNYLLESKDENKLSNEEWMYLINYFRNVNFGDLFLKQFRKLSYDHQKFVVEHLLTDRWNPRLMLNGPLLYSSFLTYLIKDGMQFIEFNYVQRTTTFYKSKIQS